MVNRKIDLRETVGLMLCVLITLLAFSSLLLLLAYSEGSRLLAAVGFLISLACPVAWLAFLLHNSGGGGGAGVMGKAEGGAAQAAAGTATQRAIGRLADRRIGPQGCIHIGVKGN